MKIGNTSTFTTLAYTLSIKQLNTDSVISEMGFHILSLSWTRQWNNEPLYARFQVDRTDSLITPITDFNRKHIFQLHDGNCRTNTVQVDLGFNCGPFLN